MAFAAVAQPEFATDHPVSGRAFRAWLGTLIGLVFAMILVGGATRLTGSGLSITEWKPIAGALPPLDSAAWNAAYESYRASPQYGILNEGMSLAEFRTIFWWEWGHRQLGRFIGLVYVAGFLWFALRRALPQRATAVLFAIGLLLGAQGLVGWIMVASGLEPGMSAVAPLKLTLHLLLACLFLASITITFVRLGGASREVAAGGTRAAATALALLMLIQIALGGLMAGHDAGLAYNTWPLMDGRLVPTGLRLLDPPWRNIIDNVAAVQFNHRVGAYLLAAAVLAYAWMNRHRAGPIRGRAALLLALVAAQIAVGIATLLLVVPLPLALAHQGLAAILLFTAVWNAAVLRPPR